MEKTLTNKEYLQEILEILREQQRREDANLLYELCANIESMENKVDMHAESLLGIVERIEKSAEKRKELVEETAEQKKDVEHVAGEVVEASAVVEECKYGLDAFDDYVKQNGTERLEKRLEQKGEGEKVR